MPVPRDPYLTPLPPVDEPAQDIYTMQLPLILQRIREEPPRAPIVEPTGFQKFLSYNPVGAQTVQRQLGMRPEVQRYEGEVAAYEGRQKQLGSITNLMASMAAAGNRAQTQERLRYQITS